MESKIIITNGKGFLYGYENGKKIGEIGFTLIDNLLTIEHTGVPKEHEGKGYAKALTMEIIKYAEEKSGIRIKPVCSYAATFFARHPEYNNLLIEHN